MVLMLRACTFNAVFMCSLFSLLGHDCSLIRLRHVYGEVAAHTVNHSTCHRNTEMTFLQPTYHFDQLGHGHLELHYDWVCHIFHRPYVLVVVGEYDGEKIVLCF